MTPIYPLQELKKMKLQDFESAYAKYRKKTFKMPKIKGFIINGRIVKL